MTECNTNFSSQMSLAVVGTYMRRQQMWNRIEQHVHIKQKTIRHTPTDKLLDVLISILSGAAGLVEINTRVRPDRAVQRAFGRQSCADQSVVSTTLNACTAETVQQLRTALTAIYREHSQGFGHDYTAQYQLLDGDMTGMPAGNQGEGVLCPCAPYARTPIGARQCHPVPGSGGGLPLSG